MSCLGNLSNYSVASKSNSLFTRIFIHSSIIFILLHSMHTIFFILIECLMEIDEHSNLTGDNSDRVAVDSSSGADELADHIVIVRVLPCYDDSAVGMVLNSSKLTLEVKLAYNHCHVSEWVMTLNCCHQQHQYYPHSPTRHDCQTSLINFQL